MHVRSIYIYIVTSRLRQSTMTIFRSRLLYTLFFAVFFNILVLFSFFFFFFQAEDGIRDVAVTGVQTCALPISVFSCIFFEKPIELPQREFALRISIAEAPLESEKTLEFARQRTVELGCHRGTGKATWRNRRRATRT